MKAKLQESQGMKVRLMCYLLKMTDNAYLTNYAAKTEASVLRVIPIIVAIALLTVFIG